MRQTCRDDFYQLIVHELHGESISQLLLSLYSPDELTP